MSDPWFWRWLLMLAVTIGCMAWALSAERGQERAEVERDALWDELHDLKDGR